MLPLVSFTICGTMLAYVAHESKYYKTKTAIREVELHDWEEFEHTYLADRFATKNYLGELNFKNFKKLIKYVEATYPDMVKQLCNEFHDKNMAKWDSFWYSTKKTLTDTEFYPNKKMIKLKNSVLSFVPNTKQNQAKKYKNLQKFEFKKQTEEKDKQCQDECDNKYGILGK